MTSGKMRQFGGKIALISLLTFGTLFWLYGALLFGGLEEPLSKHNNLRKLVPEKSGNSPAMTKAMEQLAALAPPGSKKIPSKENLEAMESSELIALIENDSVQNFLVELAEWPPEDFSGRTEFNPNSPLLLTPFEWLQARNHIAKILANRGLFDESFMIWEKTAPLLGSNSYITSTLAGFAIAIGNATVENNLIVDYLNADLGASQYRRLKDILESREATLIRSMKRGIGGEIFYIKKMMRDTYENKGIEIPPPNPTIFDKWKHHHKNRGFQYNKTINLHVNYYNNLLRCHDFPLDERLVELNSQITADTPSFSSAPKILTSIVNPNSIGELQFKAIASLPDNFDTKFGQEVLRIRLLQLATASALYEFETENPPSSADDLAPAYLDSTPISPFVSGAIIFDAKARRVTGKSNELIETIQWNPIK